MADAPGFYVSAGLLTAKHAARIGPSLWEFLWLVSHETREKGKVLNGAPITTTCIAQELGESIRTANRNLTRLWQQGYVTRQRKSSGDVYSYAIANSKKWKPTEDKNVLGGRTKMSSVPGVPRTKMSWGQDKNVLAYKEVDRSRYKPSPRKKRSDGDPRFKSFVEAIKVYWDRKNSIQFSWDGSEGKSLKQLLAASPKLTVEEFRRCLSNRAASDGVAHSERPRTWLGNVLKYANGPLDRYGKPNEDSTTGKPTGKPPLSASEIARRQQSGEEWRQ